MGSRAGEGGAGEEVVGLGQHRALLLLVMWWQVSPPILSDSLRPHGL